MLRSVPSRERCEKRVESHYFPVLVWIDWEVHFYSTRFKCDPSFNCFALVYTYYESNPLFKLLIWSTYTINSLYFRFDTARLTSCSWLLCGSLIAAMQFVFLASLVERKKPFCVAVSFDLI